MATILVTGASSGIGLSTARLLASRGHRVFGTSRRSPEAVLAKLGEQPFTFVTMDVREPDSVAAAVAEVHRQIAAELGAEAGLDVVVNNAGMGVAGALEDTSDAEALEQMDTNFLGVHRVCRAVLPDMRARGRGRIVNVSSLAGRITLPFQGFYSASKYALSAYTEALRMELRVFGVSATLIEPGDFQTGFTDARQLAAASEGSAYAPTMTKAMAVFEADELSGRSPDEVARTIARAIDVRNPRVRYTVGPLGQRLGVMLRSVMPERVFEAIFSKLYKLR